ncbi:MAG: 4Fe-4S dicluster domain-containing protein [bacterium]|nr:4Fe-4S dicluster domain-containing protein [bacterium]
MYEWGRRRIKYESELDPAFCQTLIEKTGNDSIRNCIQCGTCSSTCPVSLYMDFTPRRLVAMAREGFHDEVLHSFTPWICASCYSCTVECPKEVKITETMYAIKQMAMDKGVHPARFPVPVLAREFYHQVKANGRTNEGRLITQLFLKTNPFKLIKQSKIGMKLFFSGRLDVIPQKIKNITQLRTLLKAVNGNGGGRAHS